MAKEKEGGRVETGKAEKGFKESVYHALQHRVVAQSLTSQFTPGVFCFKYLGFTSSKS